MDATLHDKQVGPKTERDCSHNIQIQPFNGVLWSFSTQFGFQPISAFNPFSRMASSLGQPEAFCNSF